MPSRHLFSVPRSTMDKTQLICCRLFVNVFQPISSMHFPVFELGGDGDVEEIQWGRRWRWLWRKRRRWWGRWGETEISEGGWSFRDKQFKLKLTPEPIEAPCTIRRHGPNSVRLHFQVLFRGPFFLIDAPLLMSDGESVRHYYSVRCALPIDMPIAE